jgi:hypothetical protein
MGKTKLWKRKTVYFAQCRCFPPCPLPTLPAGSQAVAALFRGSGGKRGRAEGDFRSPLPSGREEPGKSYFAAGTFEEKGTQTALTAPNAVAPPSQKRTKKIWMSVLWDIQTAILTSSNKRRLPAMEVQFRYVRGHVEVFNLSGAFLFSADTMAEALEELQEDAA